MMGNNLKTHLEHLEKQMRDAAADLDFETAARLRDEIKRLRETELAISDDPLAREVEGLSPVSGREKGKHNKGRALHRAVDGRGTSSAVDGREGGGSRMRAALPRTRQALARRRPSPRKRGEASRCSQNPRSTTWGRARMR